MYDGTIAMKAAAVSPAPLPRISLTKRYAANEQKAENRGAVNTQTYKHTSILKMLNEKLIGLFTTHRWEIQEVLTHP